MNKFYKIEKCRVCGNEHLITVLDLGDQYLSGIFPKEIDEDMYKGPQLSSSVMRRKVVVDMFNLSIPLIFPPCTVMSMGIVLV